MFDSSLAVPPALPAEIPVEQILVDYERIAAVLEAGSPVGQVEVEEAPWLDETSVPEQSEQPPLSRCAPSGWLALELDHGSMDPARLSDTELIDAVIGFDRVASWASARQARVLAEFARRRPGDHPYAARCNTPSRLGEFAPDEVGLALRLSRTSAIGRLVQAETVVADLPGTLAAWEAGRIDTLKARAVTETSYLVPRERRAALEARVLPRAGTQTVSQLRAALSRAVLALDPQGAAQRYEQRRKDRRVVVSPDEEGMASLWALLSAPDATAAYHRLGDLARALGADDPRGMDARRADLLVDLLTGRRCAATGPCTSQNCACGGQDTPREENCSGPGTADTSETDHRRCSATFRATGSGKPLISVIVPITMLLGLDDQPGELVGHGPLPAALAREIAAEGIWRRLLTDPASGTLLDYGRTTYTPPAGLADFVRARDLYCRHPGCGQRAATADLDHTIAWGEEGTTSEHNLSAACRHHHRLKTHAPGWRVDQHPDDQITWSTPTGHTYTSHPHDYRPDPIGQTRPPPRASGHALNLDPAPF